MFCTQCGNAVEQHARFCSKCGKEVTPVPVEQVQEVQQVQQQSRHDMSMHINILGWLLVGSATLTGIAGLAAMLVGRLIERMPVRVPPHVPFDVMHFAGGITTIVGFAILAVSCGIAAAGIGLLQYRSWARVLAIVVSALMIFQFFPLGLVVAIYAFWVLFSQEGQEYYRARSADTMA
ncbi:MAG TPA: zinc ribbon domain-containing protein [Terriglobia bacterium]|nr:zinc ribbon domain-containing protein [Terriglobia bacterium]